MAQGVDLRAQEPRGDVAFGAKRTVFHSRGTGTILSAAAEVSLPTGNEDRGFGSGHTTVEGFLAFGQALPADGFIQAQTGVGVPTNGARKEVFWRLVGGKTFTSIGYRWAQNSRRDTVEGSRFIRFYDSMAPASSAVLAKAAPTVR